MYLFSRRARLRGGNGMAGVEWGLGIAGRVTEVCGTEVSMWMHVLSPGFGTVSWTAWFEDLTAIETMFDEVGADATYNEMSIAGAEYLEGGADDGCFQPILGSPDPERPVQYVAAATAIVAGGAFERAMGMGIELVQHGEKVTGIPGIFGRALTGPYGSVGWLTGYESLAQMERANDALAADASMLAMIDGTKGCFVEDAGAATTTLHRKLG